ncbi:phosphoglucomutase [Pelistega indica]|uniref:Phosphoglucomutase n=1 Tax=Pelistega indica TaxID=1414851 RepID=V8G772_9BURK|nr:MULTISPECIES: phosphomannomutase/phosphoglucomutase [Pelistega]ETD72265.1 phosphoglucomutase [Pelistega indica]
MTQINPNVFKAYDIRGIFPTQINTEFALLLGRALGARTKQLGHTQFVIGFDGRHSSPELAKALSTGLQDQGLEVINIGMVPTPLVYFYTYAHHIGACVAITGSHNPPDYNGFKMMLDGKAIYGEAVISLKQEMLSLDQQPLLKASGSEKNINIIPDYIKRICSDIKLARPMHIAIDAGNGIGGKVAPELFRSLGCTVDELFCDVNADFPNHHPDPADPHNLEDLIKHVKESDCEIGLAFDGDGDRLGVVTKSGEIIWPDRQLILYSQDVLKREPGATIVFDVKCSRHVAEQIEAAGGTALMWQTGHSLIKQKMKDVNAALGGEMSGHTFFKERWYGFDDGLYTGTRLLEILSAYNNPSTVLEALPQDKNTPEIKVEMQEGQPHALIKVLQEKASLPTAKRLITIDGIRAEYEDGFGLARASNTTPVLVLRFEGRNEESLARIKAEFKAMLKEHAGIDVVI